MSQQPSAAAGPIPEPSGPPEGAEAAVSTPVRLLLVDDEPGLRTAVKAFLEDEGFQVTTANDGEEGWTAAQAQMPDVVITDVMMPRCDGYGLLKRLRADERLGAVALVEPFSIDNGLLTQTLKQRRDRIADRDRAALAALYGEGGSHG